MELELSGAKNQSSFFPAAAWLRNYKKQWISRDLIAGLVAAAVVIPKAMAFATIAGLPVQVGLYTAFVPMIIYVLLGTSRPLSVSTTTTISVLTAAELARVAPDGDPAALITAAATLAVMVGGMLLLASLLRLGFIANFISDPVLTGFKAAIGVVIVLDQAPKLLGLHITKVGFFRDLLSILQHLSQTSKITLAVSIATLLFMIVLERLTQRVPAPLVAVALGIAASGLLGLSHYGVSMVGNIPRGLPHVTKPDFGMLQEMWVGAAGIALMSFTESIAAARAFTRPGEARPLPNKELFALGAANIAGGFFNSMPAGGGATQTAVNHNAGAQSQMAEVVTAAAGLATLLLLAPMIALMPNATLAAVVIMSSASLIKPAEFRDISRVRKTEFYWAIVAFAGVVFLGTLRGILVAVITSLLALAQQAYNPSVYTVGRKRGTHAFRQPSSAHPEDETWPGLLILRVEGRVFFANAQRVGDKMWALIEQSRPSTLVIDCSSIIDIEYTALKMLAEAEEKLQENGVTLWLAALNPVVFSAVSGSRTGQKLGQARMFLNVQSAVERFEQMKAVEDQASGHAQTNIGLRKVV
jgi:SulP family sulfate permease